MPALKRSETPQDDEARVEELADRALAIIREGLKEAPQIRKRVFALLVERLEPGELKTLIRDIGVRGIMRALRSR